jgi:aerobic carbon-monoxide dehydrogenase medium subunit
LPIPPPRSGMCFSEVARRRGDFALIGVACSVQLDESARCVAARIALCHAGDTPILAEEAAASLTGELVSFSAIDRAADLVQRAIDPGGNVHASKEFQRHLAGILTKRTLAMARERVRRDH